MKKIIAILLCVCILVGFASCGGDSGMDYSKLEPAANVKVDEIDPGMVREGDKTSDEWYPNGEEGNGYIFFTYGSSGFVLTFVDKDGNELDSFSPEVEDEHLKYYDSNSELAADIVFYDVCTAYDYVGETWYARGNVAEMKAYVAGRKFINQAYPDESIQLNEDGTFNEVYEGDEYEGTWDILNATQIKLDYGSYYDDYDLIFDEKGNCTGLATYFMGEIEYEFLAE